MSEVDNRTKNPVKPLKGLKGIRLAIGDSYTDSLNKIYNRARSGDKTARDFLGAVSARPSDFLDYKGYVEPQEAPELADWGNSIWDDASGVLINPFPEQIQDLRAANQGTASKWLNGTLKAVVLAGTTIGDAIGMLYGVGKMASNWNKKSGWDLFADVYNNEITNAMSDVNEWAEKVLPNYKSVNYENEPFWEHFGTANLWADGIIKNMGFIVGGVLSGGAAVRGLKAIGLIRGANATRFVGSLFGGLNEATFLAATDARDFYNYETKLREDQYSRAVLEVLENDQLSDLDKLLALLSINESNEALKLDINHRMNVLGGVDFLANAVMLPFTEFWSYGRLFARGFSDARKFKRGVTEAVDDIATREAGIGQRIRSTVDKIKNYEWNELTTKKAIGTTALKATAEGFEEMNQLWITNATSEAQRSDDPDAYYKAMINGESEIKTKDTLEAIAKGFVTSYGDKSLWELFVVAAITNLIGIPTFGKVNNAGSETWLGNKKSIGITGGVLGELSRTRELNKYGRTTVNEMNDFANKFKLNQLKFAMSDFFTNAMNGYSLADDSFNWHNARDNDLAAAFSRYALAGKLLDFEEMVDMSFDNLSDEDLETIAKGTSSNNLETSVDLGWRNPDGSYKSDTEAGRQEMRAELQDKKKLILELLKEYEKSLNTVRAISNNSLDPSKEDELAWLLWKTKRFPKRYNDILNSENTKLTLDGFHSSLRQFKAVVDRERQELEVENPEVTLPENEDTEAGKTYNENKKLLETVNTLLLFFDAILSDNGTMKGAAYVKTLVKDKKWLEYLLNKDTFELFSAFSPELNYTDYSDAIKLLGDLGRLAIALDDFNKRYTEFVSNPIAMDKNREKLNNKELKNRKAQEKKHSKSKFYNDDGSTKSPSEINQGLDSGDITIDDLNNLGENSDEIEDFPEVENDIPEDFEETAKSAKELLLKNLKLAKEIRQLAGRIEKRLKQTTGISEPVYNLAFKILKQNSLNSDSIDSLFDPNSELNMDSIGLGLDFNSQDDVDTLNKSLLLLQNIKNKLLQEDSDNNDMPTLEVTPENTEDPSKNNNASNDPIDPVPSISPSTESPLVEIIERSNLGATSKSLSEIDNIENQSINNTDKSNNNSVDKKKVWIPATSLFARGQNKGVSIPYFELVPNENVKSRLERLYKYLEKRGAFLRAFNIKSGDEIHFAISKTLSEPINGKVVYTILILDKNNNVVGDLLSNIDKTVNDYTGLSLFYEEAIRDFENNNNNAELVGEDLFILKKNGKPIVSHVALKMVGRPNYTPIYDMRRLSEFPNIEIGIAMLSGVAADIRTNGKSINEISDEERSIMSPLETEAGTPYLLIPTGDPNRSKYCVPFLVLRYLAPLHPKLSEVISKIISDIHSKKTITDTDLGALKSKLLHIFNIDDININIHLDNEGNSVLVLNVKDNYLNIPLSLNISSSDINNFFNDFPINISRKYINTKNFLGTNYSYNEIIAEASYTNIGDVTHTVNDWFTINPIDEKGNEISAEFIPTTGKNPSQPEIPIPGKEDSNIPPIQLPDKPKLLTQLLLNDSNIDYKQELLDSSAIKKVKTLLNIVNNLEENHLKLLYDFIKNTHDKLIVEEVLKELKSKRTLKKLIEFIENLSQSKFLKEDNRKFELWDLEKETKTVLKMLPLIDREDAIRISRLFIKTNGNERAWGKFLNGVITIYKGAAKGTLYHEAFHFVFNSLLTDQEIENVFLSAEKIYKIKDKLEIEERLAEDFRKYVLLQEKPLIGPIIKVFRTLKNLVNKIFNNKNYIENLFYNISRDKLSDRNTITNRSKNTKYREVEELLITSNKEIKERIDRANIIYGHPALGKSAYLIKNDNILDWDDEVNDKRNKFIDSRLNELYGELSPEEYSKRKSEYLINYNLDPKYKEFLDKEWDRVTTKAKNLNKKLFVSPIALLDWHKDDFDLFIDIPTLEFVYRNMQRGKSYDLSVSWKLSIDKLFEAIPKDKVVVTEDYLSNILGVEKDILKDAVTFMSNFGITLNDIKDYNGELPLFDAVNRIINFKSVEDITDGVGLVIAFMCQHQKSMQDLILMYYSDPKAIRRSIRIRGEYNIKPNKRLLNEIKNNKSKILQEIGKDIAIELRKLYNIEETKPKGIVSKILQVILDFFEMLTPENRNYFSALRGYTKSLAAAVPLNDKSKIVNNYVKPGTDSLAEIVNIELAFKENPYEVNIIEKLQKYNITLAGSASIALNGTLYRPKENPLHDIDFDATGLNSDDIRKIINTEFEHNTYIRTIPSDTDPDSYTETYLIMDREFITLISSLKSPKGKPIYNIYDKNTLELLGYYFDSDLFLKEGIKGKFLDFFAGSGAINYGTLVFTLNNKLYKVSDYRTAMLAKIRWAREKDIWDYNRFIPNKSIIEQYHAHKLSYNNLDADHIAYLKHLNMSELVYEKLTLQEKEDLFECM